ncbi:MAG: DUF4625 domain-containing protein [Paludibacteraceae bacterium]|nr:DUF4625 domain-containing protein [Paludibacteraceae bacterium]
MGKNILFFVLSAIMCVSFSACDEDEADTTKPVITLDEPEDGDSLRIGESVHFEADFSDDEALGSYLIEIHNNFDGHNHKVSSTRAEETVPFSLKKSYDLSNLRNTHVHHHDIVIPENATPGAYHLVVYCTDAAGNQSMVARDIILSLDAESHHHHHDGDDDDDDHDHDHE